MQNWKEWRTTHWRFGGGSGVRASLKQGRQEQCACWIELRLSKSQSLQGGIAEANSVWTSTAATCGTDTPRRSLAGVTVISSQVPFGTSYAASIFQVHRQRMKRLARLVRISSKQPSPELSQQVISVTTSNGLHALYFEEFARSWCVMCNVVLAIVYVLRVVYEYMY